MIYDIVYVIISPLWWGYVWWCPNLGNNVSLNRTLQSNIFKVFTFLHALFSKNQDVTKGSRKNSNSFNGPAAKRGEGVKAGALSKKKLF